MTNKRTQVFHASYVFSIMNSEEKKSGEQRTIKKNRNDTIEYTSGKNLKTLALKSGIKVTIVNTCLIVMVKRL